MSEKKYLKHAPVLFQINQCEYENCRFRFPTIQNDPAGNRCPKCGRRAGQEVPLFSPHSIPRSIQRPVNCPSISLLLDNVRSALNVGSIFRSAEACGVEKILLGGVSPSPEMKSLKKTALDAESVLPWESVNNSLDCVLNYKQAGYLVFSLEGGDRSIPVDAITVLPSSQPVLLVAGNEVCGVDPQILDLSDVVFHLPMSGEKQSYNVAIAAGIALYLITFRRY